MTSMKDKKGTDIKIGTLLTSELFPDATPVQCVELSKKEIHLRHTSAGSMSIILSKEKLATSVWVVTGFSKID